MNIFEAKRQLLDYFLDKDSLTVADFNKLTKTKNISDEQEAAIKLGLAELVELKVISSITVGSPEKQVWVLSKPLLAYEQSIPIDGLMALKISTYVNKFLQIAGEEPQSNPLNVSKDDLTILFDMIDLYAESHIQEKKNSQS